MSAANKEAASFDYKLAKECVFALSRSAKLGCTMSDSNGNVLCEAGNGCASCTMCDAAGQNSSDCTVAHIYGVAEAERFGGKYIYFCPMGLTCFVSPILGQSGSAAKITAGPFLMVDREDYIDLDLVRKRDIPLPLPDKVAEALSRIPYISPEQVNDFSTLLFMAVGYLNDASAASRMRDAQTSEIIQGQVGAYISDLKTGEDVKVYPLAAEKALTAAIADSDRDKAQALLNELLGHIMFSSCGDIDRIKSRIYELLVLMSRAAVDAGASPDKSFEMNHNFFQRAHSIHEIDELCYLISDVMTRFTDGVFRYSDVRNLDVLHKAVQYAKENFASRITLEDVANRVYLSSSYFSKVFKKEMGVNFNTWLNNLRIEKSKRLLLENIRLADIAGMVGFEDQSYFSRVFKKATGVSPNRYREANGKNIAL